MGGEKHTTTVGEFSLLTAGGTATKSLRPFGLYAGDEQRGWVNVLGETISENPHFAPLAPPAEELLRGLSQIPTHLKPDEPTITQMLHTAYYS